MEQASSTKENWIITTIFNYHDGKRVSCSLSINRFPSVRMANDYVEKTERNLRSAGIIGQCDIVFSMSALGQKIAEILQNVQYFQGTLTYSGE